MDETAARPRDTTYFVLALLLVAIYFVLRTAAVPDFIVAGWTIAACVAALVSPLAGLTVLAAIGPFTEALSADGRVTAGPFLLAALGASLLIQLVLRPRPSRLSLPLVAALGLFAVTLLGVLESTLAFGVGRGLDAFEAWVPGVGGGLTALLVAAWLAWRGELRPLAIAIGAITVAALVSLADFFGHGAVQHSAFGWLVHGGVAGDRLHGVIDAPNPAAALFLAALAVTLSAAVFGRPTRMRLVAGLATAALGVAVVATYSRSALLAVGVVVVLLGWQWRRWLGVALTIAGAAVALVLASGTSLIRQVPQVADSARIDAWRASVAMWLDAPLSGHGFRSFEWLHASYGSGLDAPHNEWLRLFAEEGALAGLVGLLFVTAVLATLLRARAWLETAIGAAAAALFVMACFNNPFWYAQVVGPAFLILGTGLGVAIARAARPTPAPSGG